MTLLRSPEWIADYGAHVGGTVWLNMPEMGVEGEAEVLDIGPAQVYDVRPGLVTGTFRHTSGEVYDLKLASESKPIGVTGTHPFWSVDRQAWVSVLDLNIGETLKTLEGTTVVESRVRRPLPEAVYNIEVEGDHCYRVGESGVLVHNASLKKFYAIDEHGNCVPPDNFNGGFYGTSALSADDIDDLFNNGLPKTGSDLDLNAHRMSNSNSAFRGTAAAITGSNDLFNVTPIKAAGAGGIVIEIRQVPGWVLDQHTSSTFGAGEHETSILAKVPPENIKKAFPIKESATGKLMIDTAAIKENKNYTGEKPRPSDIMP